MRSQSRTLRLPAADADVDVVALREDPGVAAGNRAQLDQRPSAIVLARVNMSNVSLERDPVRAAAGEPERAHGQPVDAVGPDRDGRRRRRVVEAHGHRFVVHLQPRGAHAVAEVGPGGRGLLGEVCVEPPPLRHQDQRLLAPPLDAAAVAQAEPNPSHGVLDHRLDRDRELADGAIGEPSPARLVAREALTVEQQHARARARETEGGGRSRRTGSDHDRIEALHRYIVFLEEGTSGARPVRKES